MDRQCDRANCLVGHLAAESGGQARCGREFRGPTCSNGASASLSSTIPRAVAERPRGNLPIYGVSGFSRRSFIQAFARLPQPSGFARFAASSSAAFVAGCAGLPRFVALIFARDSADDAASRPRAAASGGAPVTSRSRLHAQFYSRDGRQKADSLAMCGPYSVRDATDDDHKAQRPRQKAP